MISTTNYVARKYGVRSAMPGFIGRKLCPELIFVKGHYEKYGIVAEQIRSIIREYDPFFSSHSLDEVYLDLTDAAMERVQYPYKSKVLFDSSKYPGSACMNSKESSVTTHVSAEQNLSLNSDTGNYTEEKHFSKDKNEVVISISRLRVAACEVLEEIRQRVAKDTGGLTCSAGIANNFLLAKICADVNKPNGQYELPASKEG